MKRNLLITLLCFSCLSLLVEAAFVKADSQLDIQDLNKRVFIGQAYPSGKVYLDSFPRNRAFSGINEGAPPPWPKELLILPLDDTKSVLGKKQMKASFVEVMKDEPDSIYIPGAEGMEGRHKSCKIEEIKEVEHYEYASGILHSDYFHRTRGYCDENKGIGVYRINPSKYSFLVLGIAPEIAVADVKLLSGKRPTTPAERQAIIKSKREDAKPLKSWGSTIPQYIDNAIQIAEIGLAQGDLRLRVSTYNDSGRDDHPFRIYVLDVLQRNKALRTIEAYRPLASDPR